MARRQPIDNLVINGDFNRVPTFVAATNVNNCVIDGTAGGSTSGSETVSPSSAKQFYQWKVNIYNATNGSAQYDTDDAPSGVASMKVTGTAVKERVNLSLGIRIYADLNQPADIRNNLIRVQPSTNYVLKFKMKTLVSNAVGTPGVYGATMQVAVHSGTSNTAITYLNGAINSRVATTTDWTNYTMTFTTGATSQYVNLFFGIFGDTNNYADMTAWFADIRLNTATGLSRTPATSRTTATNRVAVRDMGTALRFDGVDDKVVATTGNMQVLAGQSRTFSMFIYPTAFNKYLFSRNTGTGDGLRVVLNSSGKINIVWESNVTTINATSTNSVPRNKWVFLLISVSATSLTINLGGTLTTSSYSTRTFTPSTGLQIGTYYVGSSFFAGMIDEFRVFNTALSADEIQKLYLYGQVPQDGLVGEYLFNEASGTTAYDTSGNGNDGTITGATYTTDVPLTLRDSI